MCVCVYIHIIYMCVRDVHFTDGRKENVMFDKITSRVRHLCYGLNQDFVDPVSLLTY